MRLSLNRVCALLLARVAFLAVTLSVCAHADDVTFTLEPTMKATTVSNGALSPGTRLSFSAKGFKANETLLLHRCGESCNTAKLIRSWHADEMASDAIKYVVISEPGKYYFWILRNLPNGEVGPVVGERSESVGTTTTVRYASGSMVSVTVSNE